MSARIMDNPGCRANVRRANVPALRPLTGTAPALPMPTPTANLPTHGDPMIGEILGGRYLVERLIDRGGMGLVYLATEVAKERHVVIKMLAPHWTEDADAVARFDREGERLAQLEHPNIVEMYEFGRAGDQAFIAMEYIDGEPLRRYLKRKQHTTLREFAPIAVQVSDAVGFAHAHEIMLRDIKPSNIMLCECDGKASFVKLLDFGLAKLVSGDDVEITKAHVVGTAGYLSPEQIKGEAIDVRVDVYALGVLFFVMLTGKTPIEGDNDAAVLYNHVHGAPRRLADELPAGDAVPQGLIDLVHACLEKDPNARPSDASAVATALRACLSAEVLELPVPNAETREAIREYRESKLGLVAADESGEADLSAEWTRPVLRKPEAGEPSPVQAGTWKNLTREAQAAARKKTPSSRPVPRKTGNPTRVGLAAVARSDGPPAPPAAPKRPESPRSLRRTGPRKIVRATAPHAPVERPGRARVGNTRPAGSGHVGTAPKERARPVGSGHVGTAARDATRPAGSGHVSKAPKDGTRPDGSGHVREGSGPRPGTGAEPRPLARKPPPEPPRPPVGSASQPVVPPPQPALSAPASAPVEPAVLTPEPQPTSLPASDDSLPITIEPERSLKVPVLVGTFVALALVTFVVVAFVVPRDGPSADEAPESGEPVAAAAVSEEAREVTPAEPEAESVPGELARVRITGPDGAEVRVDGESRGPVPLELELPVGRRSVEVSSPRHATWRTEVDLVAGDNPPIAAEPVEPAPAITRGSPKTTPQPRSKSEQATPTPEQATPTPEQPKSTPKSEPRAEPPPPPPVETPPRKPEPLMPSSRDDDDPFLPVGKKK